METFIAGAVALLLAGAGFFLTALWGYLLDGGTVPPDPRDWKIGLLGGVCILLSVLLGIVV